VAFFVSDLAKLQTRSEACDILVLDYLSPIESNRVMIMTPKPTMKLGFTLGIKL